MRAALDRPAARGDAPDGRQGLGARGDGEGGRAHAAGHRASSRATSRPRRRSSASGCPVIIKASAGGGGRGMKIVESKARLSAQLSAARSEAQAGVRQPRGLPGAVHRAPRHIEVQVLGDGNGAVAPGRARVLDPAPPPEAGRGGAVGGARRRAALAAAGHRAQGDRGHRLPDRRHASSSCSTRTSFYFMEMNTRIQVEHTVTEEVFGVDLVREQIRIAAGEPLKLAHGHPPARSRHRAAHQRRGPRHVRAFAGPYHRAEPARRPWRPGRYPHLRPVCGPPVLRFAAGQADRPRREPAGGAGRGCGGRWPNSSSKGARPTSTSSGACWPIRNTSQVRWIRTSSRGCRLGRPGADQEGQASRRRSKVSGAGSGRARA